MITLKIAVLILSNLVFKFKNIINFSKITPVLDDCGQALASNLSSAIDSNEVVEIKRYIYMN